MTSSMIVLMSVGYGLLLIALVGFFVKLWVKLHDMQAATQAWQQSVKSVRYHTTRTRKGAS